MRVYIKQILKLCLSFNQCNIGVTNFLYQWEVYLRWLGIKTNGEWKFEKDIFRNYGVLQIGVQFYS
jgi:hypothetical protein